MGTRELVSELTIDGVRCRWSIERYTRYTSEGYRGLCGTSLTLVPAERSPAE
jgi:hypothetical protein